MSDRGGAPEDSAGVGLVGFEGLGALHAALRSADLEVSQLDGAARPDTPPRAVLVSGGVASDLPRMRALLRACPLVPVFAVAPRASAVEVRELLRMGLADVWLDIEDDPRAIAARVRDELDSQQLLPAVQRLSEREVRRSRYEGLLSRSHAMWELFEQCERVAPTQATVLICGETGTGKDLLARALHNRSGRRGRLVALNCSAIPEHLVEAQLFGHERGAFTGAVRDNPGLFRRADQGTLFLDEIGDMPASAQQSLLRVLEDGRVRGIGSAEEIPVDVRVVAATHVGLESAVSEQRFREDLFYRIDVIRFEIPPLRHRPEDIIYLYGHFTKRLARHYGLERPRLGTDFLAALTRHDWPGNVRELENFAERLLLSDAPGDPRTARDVERLLHPLGDSEGGSEPALSLPADPRLDLRLSLAENLEPVLADLERRYLRQVLELAEGRIGDAAKRAGISRRTLQRKLAAYGWNKRDFR